MPDKLPPDTALGWPEAIDRFADRALVAGLREAEQEHAAAEAAVPKRPTESDCLNFRSGYSDRPYEVAVDMWRNRSAVRRADTARKALQQAQNAAWADVYAKLCSAELCVWGQEDPVASRYQRLPANLWESGRARRQGNECVAIRTTPLRVFYNIRVARISRPLDSPAPATAARPFRPAGGLLAALRREQASLGRALTVREAEAFGASRGDSRERTRIAWRQLNPAEARRPGRKPRNQQTTP